MKIPKTFVTILASAFIVLCISANSGAANWQLIFIEETGLELYIDSGSLLRIDDNTVRVWGKSATRKPSDPSILYLLDVDCQFQAFRTLQTISQDDSDSQKRASPEWQPLDRIGSLEARERFFNAVCAAEK